MGMQQNWQSFIDTTKAKSKSHMKAARYWDTVNNVLNLSMIFLAAATTFLALLNFIPTLAVAGMAGISTLLSTVTAFLRASERRQVQADASKVFKSLMMKMVRCEEETEYEGLWKEFNKAILEEPFLPKKYVSTADIEWTMTPELLIVIKGKEEEVKSMLNGITNADIDNSLIDNNEITDRLIDS